MEPTSRKLRAGIHARRSLNRDEAQSASVRRQIEEATALAARIDAEVVKVYDEDDTSAFLKRVVTLPNGRRVRRNVRPVWQDALTDLYSGAIDVLIEYDLDRAMREPRDLEDLIEVIETTGRAVESVTGSLRLRNDHEITMARVMVAMANKSSRDTSRRVRDAARERAVKGLYHGGRRPFGYTANGLDLVPDEAAEVAAAFDKFLSGVPLGAIVRDLNGRSIRTVGDRTWAPGTLRDLLLSARHAGLSEYRGEVVGTGQWPAIVSEEVWRATVALLTDPARRTSTGNRASYLLSGIATCGVCGGSITASGMKRSTPKSPARHIYRCRTGFCVGRRRDWCDDYVAERVFERLTRDDVEDLLVDEDVPDFAALKVEAEGIRRRLDDAAASYAREAIDGRQLEVISRALKVRLDEIGKLQQHNNRVPALRGLVAAALSAAVAERTQAVEAVWVALTLDHQRAVVSELMSIQLLPGGGGSRRFDPSKVLITPRR